MKVLYYIKNMADVLAFILTKLPLTYSLCVSCVSRRRIKSMIIVQSQSDCGYLNDVHTCGSDATS